MAAIQSRLPAPSLKLGGKDSTKPTISRLRKPVSITTNLRTASPKPEQRTEQKELKFSSDKNVSVQSTKLSKVSSKVSPELNEPPATTKPQSILLEMSDTSSQTSSTSSTKSTKILPKSLMAIFSASLVIQN